MAKPDVKLKHKVQLRRKVEESGDYVPPVPPPEPPKSKSWLWIIFGLIVLGIGAYFLFSNIGVVKTSPVIEDATEVVEEVVTNETDTVTEVPTDTVEATSATEEIQEVSEVQSQEEVPDATVTTRENDVTSKSTTKAQITGASSDVETEAMNVIRGEYGNAPVRYDLLREKGLDPQAIQQRVNELKRQGIF